MPDQKQLLTYRKFDDQAQLDDLTNLLRDHHIEFQVVEGRDSLDALYGGDLHRRYFEVRLFAEDFNRADALQAQQVVHEAADISQDHYLYTFTNEELLDILAKPDEWSALDYELARRLLKDRGQDLNDFELQQLRQKRVDALAKPEESKRSWIILGYLSCLLLAGLPAVFIGHHLSTFRKTLPNGQRVHAYVPRDRKHGGIMFIIGLMTIMIHLTSWLIFMLKGGRFD